MSKKKRMVQRNTRREFVHAYLCRQSIRSCWVRLAGGPCGHDE